MSNYDCEECGKSLSDISITNGILYCPFCGSLVETNHSSKSNRQWVPYYANIPLTTFATNEYSKEYSNYTIIELFDEKNSEINHLSHVISSKIEELENDVQSIETSDTDITVITSEDIMMEKEHIKINEPTVNMTIYLLENDLSKVNYTDSSKFVSRIIQPWKKSYILKNTEYDKSILDNDNIIRIIEKFDSKCNTLNLRVSEREDKLDIVESMVANYNNFISDILENVVEIIGDIIDDLYTILGNNHKEYNSYSINKHFIYQKELSYQSNNTHSNDYLCYILIQNVLNYMNEIEIICASYEFIDGNIPNVLDEKDERASLYNINTHLDYSISECGSISKVIPDYYDNALMNIYKVIEHVSEELLDKKFDSIYENKFELHNDIYVNKKIF